MDCSIPMSKSMKEAAQPQGDSTDPLGEDDTFLAEGEASAEAPAAPAPEAAESAQLAEMKDQLLRTLAEMENVRRRATREVDDIKKYAVTGFARDLIQVIENLRRASESVPADLKAEHAPVRVLSEGVDMTLRELLNIFARQGIRRIDPLGEKFDHNYHQAVAQIADNDAEPGTILQVLQAGYVIHDRLLQPAMVGVATRTDSAPILDTQV